MKIEKTTKFNRELKKLKARHYNEELKVLIEIEDLIKDSLNLKALLLNPLKFTYSIEQKEGDLRIYFTANLNNKIRLIMKPIGEYPYDIDIIDKIEFYDINTGHQYGRYKGGAKHG